MNATPSHGPTLMPGQDLVVEPELAEAVREVIGSAESQNNPASLCKSGCD
jgi:hypothetical protein